MARRASDVKVAILTATGFEQDELTEPRQAIRQAGLLSDIVSPEKGTIKGWYRSDWGEEIPVDVALDSADPDDYDILFLSIHDNFHHLFTGVNLCSLDHLYDTLSQDPLCKPQVVKQALYRNIALSLPDLHRNA